MHVYSFPVCGIPLMKSVPTARYTALLQGQKTSGLEMASIPYTLYRQRTFVHGVFNTDSVVFKCGTFIDVDNDEFTK